MKTYFENIARRLIDINHDPDNNRKRFYLVHGTSAMFSFTGNNDFLNDMHAHPTEPVMVYLLDYSGRLAGTSIDNKWRLKTGQVFIVKKLKLNDFAAINTWMAECETILEKVLARIDTDIHSGDLLPTFNLLNTSVLQVHNQADGFHGLGISFSWNTKFCKHLNPADWLP